MKHSTIELGRVTASDDPTAIGALIYHTDPWVYPDLFGNIRTAERAAAALLSSSNVYNADNIVAARVDGKIAGFMTLIKRVPSENTESLRRAVAGACDAFPTKFDDVVAGYFDCIAPDPDKTEILSLSVLPEFRRMGIAESMLSALDPNVTYTLACVKDNAPARKLYSKCGFEFLYEYPGYTGIPCVELIKRAASALDRSHEENLRA